VFELPELELPELELPELELPEGLLGLEGDGDVDGCRILGWRGCVEGRVVDDEPDGEAMSVPLTGAMSLP
jgi:hypothetical protein